MMLFSSLSMAQNEEVRIEIPNKADLRYDGERIQIESTNTFLGNRVGSEITDGLSNTFLGESTGFKNSTGSRNTYLGAEAGFNSNGEGNIFLGYRAGYGEDKDNRLYISNSETDRPLIFGDFSNKFVQINDDLVISRNITVESAAVIKSALTVTGPSSLGNTTINHPLPTLQLQNSSTSNFLNLVYNSTQASFFLQNESGAVLMNIDDGEMILPTYAGSATQNVAVDATGRLVKTSLYQKKYNRFEFDYEEDFVGYKKMTMGVQIEDGTIVSNIKAIIRDNDFSASNGITNTVFAGLYRVNKFTGNQLVPQVIYRIDASDTPSGIHIEFSANNAPAAELKTVNNADFIYLLQVWVCDDCSIMEVEIIGN